MFLSHITKFAILAMLVALLAAAIIYSVHTKPSNQYNHAECTNVAQILAQISVVETSTINSGAAVEIEEDTKKTKFYDQEKFDNMSTCSALKAQWETADTTHYAYWAGVVGIALIFATLVYTAISVSITKDTAKKQLRAYISTVSMSTLGVIDEHGKPINRPNSKAPIKITTEFTNVGSTPANRVVVNICNFMEYKDGRIERLRHKKLTLGSFSPNGSRHHTISWGSGSDSILRYHEQSEIVQGIARVVIEGWVEYIDIYNIKRATFFRGYLAGAKLDGVGLNMSYDGNQMV